MHGSAPYPLYEGPAQVISCNFFTKKVIGLGGVDTVEQRTGEIGLRMAPRRANDGCVTARHRSRDEAGADGIVPELKLALASTDGTLHSVLVVDWEPYTLRFRQSISDGLRYFDRCGQFMLAAIEQHDMMPGEVTPTGAHLTVPESGVRTRVDSTALEVNQERPVDEALFVGISAGLAALSQKHFGPLHVELNLFEIKLLIPMNTEIDAERAMLTIQNGNEASLAKEFGMPLKSRRWETIFESGSQRLQVSLSPVAFETVRVHQHNSPLAATPSQVRRAKRLTAAAQRIPQYAPYAVFLEVTLAEREPALSTEEKMFSMLLAKAEVAKGIFKLK